MIQRTRDREIGDYEREGNMRLAACHEPRGGFLSTTLGGDGRNRATDLRG
ncbi:MAG: hypothetical protein QOH70_1395 [Blastocatellia bacterium]|nr:hypothetical protein [Blastocatellia bacterium]